MVILILSAVVFDLEHLYNSIDNNIKTKLDGMRELELNLRDTPLISEDNFRIDKKISFIFGKN